MKKNKKSPFQKGWKDYLSFSTREKYGIYLLLFIFLLQISFTYYLNFTLEEPENDSGEWLNDSALAWMQFQEMAIEERDIQKREFSDKKSDFQVPVYFHFNPNTCSGEDLQRLGLNSRQVKTILKYRSYGTGLKSKSDFRKIYCISTPEFLRLEPWIDLPDTFIYSHTFKSGKKEPKQIVPIDLSLTDSIELLRLPGIGPAFARRIIKFRDRLGGYSGIEQIKEVWGMTDSLYLVIAPHLSISDSTPASIAINSITLTELGKHPYVGFTIAKVIVSYREQHGSFKTIDQFSRVPLVTEEIFRKLAPYLDLEEK